jgi:hypothetical protein
MQAILIRELLIESGFGAHLGTYIPPFNFFSRHINPFLVCFPSRAWDSGVQKWFQNFDSDFFSSKSTQKYIFVDFLFFGLTLTKKVYKKN